MAKKKVNKKAAKDLTVKLKDTMPFDEFMQRIVRVKPPSDKPKTNPE